MPRTQTYKTRSRGLKKGKFVIETKTTKVSSGCRVCNKKITTGMKQVKLSVYTNNQQFVYYHLTCFLEHLFICMDNVEDYDIKSYTLDKLFGEG